MSEMTSPYEWFRVPNPIQLKRRVCIETRNAAFIIVKTNKVKAVESTLYTNPIEQSDYVNIWEQYGKNGDMANDNFDQQLKTYIKNNTFLYPVAKMIKSNIRTCFRKLKNPQLISNHKDLIRENILNKIK